ncbi:MAG: HNH endonuclease signature motif containing protein [Candidatus Competibacteraceae bacterium]
MSRTYITAALRRLVYQRAGDGCEYCQMPEQFSFHPHQVDHVIPEKHDGQTDAANCALVCILCNQHKGSDLASIDPLTRQIIPFLNRFYDSKL